ncbi:MAG: hypothetical protein OK439_06265, partial [Thaumarchaeota archaeon]|nr:hypothetical protein [Nitrososphaerota archaeon]
TFFPSKKGVKSAKMKQLSKSIEQKHSAQTTATTERWNEGIANYEKLKKLLPFLNEEEGYL